MKNKSTLTFYTFLLICCVSLISIEKATAQENEIFELTEDNNQSKVRIRKHKDNKRGKFYALAHKIHTTAYIENNVVTKVNGKGQIKKMIFKDSKTSDILKLTDSEYDNVELIIVTLKSMSDLNNKLDLLNINDKLKYVFIKCQFKCTKKQIKNFIKIKPKSHIRVFYTSKSAA